MTHRMVARGCAALTGALFGLAIGLLVGSTDWVLLVEVVILAPLVLLLVRVVVPREHRATLYALSLLAFALRSAIAVGIYVGSVALGRGGFVTGDDQAYAQFAWALASYARGDEIQPWVPPYWNSDFHLFGLLTYIQATLYFVFGFRPLLIILLNAALGAAAVPLLFELARSVFGRSAALVSAVGFIFFPSVALWSAMNLKEALSVFLLSAVLLAIARFHSSPNRWAFALVFLPLVPMQSLRQYQMILLSLIIPIGVLLTPGLGRRPRVLWAATAVILSSLAIVANLSAFRPDMLVVLETGRRDRALAARTAIEQGSQTVHASTGDTFVVLDPSPGPACAPRVVVVQPGTRLRVGDGCSTGASEPGSVLVNSGDVVVVGAPGTTPKPVEQRSSVVVRSGGQALPGADIGGELVVTIGRGSDALGATLAYIPRGFLHAAFAPFPFVRASYGIFTTPEQIVWYLLLAVAIAAGWLERRRWMYYTPMVLVVLGQIAVLTLIEGNIGTLYRHRGLIVPFVIALAAPGVVRALHIVRARGAQRSSVASQAFRPRREGDH